VGVPAESERKVKLTQLSLEELAALEVDTVYVASKHPQKTAEAPFSVSVVTAGEIQKFGYRTLTEVLQSVRGFYSTYDRSYSFIGVRGVGRPGDFGGRVLVMINGHRLNDPVFDQAFNGTEFPMDVDLIERVEVVRGPDHSLYGNNALLAVVNVVTKTGATSPGFEASTSAGSFDTFTGRLSYGAHTASGVDLLFSGTGLSSAGDRQLHFPEFNEVNGGTAHNMDGQWDQNYYASIAYKDFSVFGFFGERHKDIPTAAYGAMFGVSPFYLEDERAGLDVKFAHEFQSGWGLSSRLFLDRYRYDAISPYAPRDGVTLSSVPNFDHADAFWCGGEVEVNKTVWERHRLALGMDFREDFNVLMSNWDLAPPATYLHQHSETHNMGAYLQDEWAVCSNLTLSGAARYDYYSSFGSTFNPRAGIIYRPLDQTTLKFLYGQAFRAANAYERDYTIPAFRYFGNPNLNPEHLRSYELVCEQGIGRHWHLTGELFYEDMSDLITQAGDAAGNFVFANTDSVRTRGAELELQGRWSSGLLARFAYTLADVDESSRGQSPRTSANSPRHLAKAALSVPLYRDRIFASLEIQGMSSRRTLADNEVPGFAVANLTLFSRELVKNLEISGSIYNLFDRRYRDPVSTDFRQDSIQQDGRTFRLKFTYRF
jgi:iron complex outermembrane receptor protein